MERFSPIIVTPLGKMVASAEKGAITRLGFVGQKYFTDASSWYSASDEPVFHALENWLADYFAGKNRKPEFRLKPKGTPFQEAVWKRLLKIPYGKTTTYGDLAKKIAAERNMAKMSAQAIGGAVGRNPISILIPCHRVLGADGSLTGYASGLEKKVFLLRLEQIITPEKPF
ncbi:MAG: methylated-DNA--[protein]-cysteine S-methyltransferase [Planctomycetaceae bacterium]|nr:methylated-DNA--[protein]-cysteine S-methyltransferase [Planctomycetaceae bacterium]